MIKAESLYSFLPHRPPLFWVDEVLSANEKLGICSVNLKTDAHYMDHNGFIRPSSLLEWMAQSTALIKAAHLKNQKISFTPTSTYLVGIKKFKIFPIFYSTPHFEIKFLTIKIETIKDLPPLSLVQGCIYHEDQNICLGSAQLKLYCS